MSSKRTVVAVYAELTVDSYSLKTLILPEAESTLRTFTFSSYIFILTKKRHFYIHLFKFFTKSEINQ